jgi:hypothetical protein
MTTINMQELNRKIIFCLVLYMAFSISSFGQEDGGWTTNSSDTPNPGSDSNDALNGGDLQETPLDNSIWILLVLGITLGAFKMQSKKEMQ